MDKDFTEFTQAIRTLEAQADFLSATSVYCIGRCSCKTAKYPVSYLMDLAKRLSEMTACGTMTEARRTVAEFLLSEGKVQNVIAMVSDTSGTKRSRESPRQISALENFTQKVQINGKTFLKNPKTQEIASSADQTLILPEPPHPPESVTSIECSICMEVVPETDFLPLEKCGCIFHQDCVLNYLVSCIENRNYPIRCPQAKCKVEMHPLDLKERLPAKMHQQFEQSQFDVFLMRNGKEFTNCPTPGCQFVFNWTKENPRFKCPTCGKAYCLLCKKEFHDGVTCEEYKKLTDPQDLDRQFAKAVQGARFQLCPQCQAWVEKVDGCNHISCVCGCDFCYHCGQDAEHCDCDERDSEGNEELPVCPNCQQEECACAIPLCHYCLLRLDMCRC